MGAWGGQQNGRIPASALANFEGTGKYGHAAAVASLSALFDAVRARSGQRPYFAGGQDFYRDFARQQYFWDNRKRLGISAATPGTSNHGWALAADISFPSAACHTAFRQLCAQYGWNNAGDGFGESWHKEYVGSLATPAGGGSTAINEGEGMLTIDNNDNGDEFWLYVPGSPASRIHAGEYAIAKRGMRSDVWNTSEIQAFNAMWNARLPQYGGGSAAVDLSPVMAAIAALDAQDDDYQAKVLAAIASIDTDDIAELRQVVFEATTAAIKATGVTVDGAAIAKLSASATDKLIAKRFAAIPAAVIVEQKKPGN